MGGVAASDPSLHSQPSSAAHVWFAAGDALYAMELSLSLEKLNFDKLLHLWEVSGTCGWELLWEASCTRGWELQLWVGAAVGRSCCGR